MTTKTGLLTSARVGLRNGTFGNFDYDYDNDNDNDKGNYITHTSKEFYHEQ